MTVTKGKGPMLAAAAVALLLVVALFGYFGEDLKTWYRVWTNFEFVKTNAEGYAEYRHRRTGIVFVRLPGGPFTIGVSEEDIAEWLERRRSNFGRAARDDRRANHMATSWTPRTVRVSPFFIAKFEITEAQWQSIMGNSSSGSSSGVSSKAAPWDIFQTFCERADLAIPTEAQWEYAFGNPMHSALTDGAGNAFGLRRRNWEGKEWCRDSFNFTCYTSGLPTEPDPVCSTPSRPSGYRVVRGEPGGRGGAPASQDGDVLLRPVFCLR